jgi:transposase
MSHRTWKLGNVKSVSVSEGDVLTGGLDVHKATVHAALRKNGQEIATWVMPMDNQTVVASLKRFGPALKKVVCEAGPTGYGLGRALKKAGLPVEVIAPGKVPQEPNPDSKSDRLDCRKLAENAEQGSLKKAVIAIPTEQEEADRQLARLRDQLVGKQRRVKQQIKSLLLQQGLPEPAGLAHWSAEGLAALKGMRLRHQLKLSLEVMIEELEHLVALRKRVERHEAWLMKQRRHRKSVARLQTHPGVGVVTATAFRLEVYQPERFATPEQLAKYVGLAPRVRQSGPKRRGGPLIKAGRGSLRSLLIEASWRWIRDDAAAAKTYRRLVRNTGSGQKAVVAMARRMAVHLWCMMCRGEAYHRAA